MSDPLAAQVVPVRRAIYSPRLDAYREVCPDPEIYIAPKAIIPNLKKFVSCPLVAVEDVTKTDTWLWLNEAVREGTRLVYDRVSRYYKVESDKARRLSRLAEIGRVCLVDIVPFCEHRRSLYMPWRYVSRSVLGHAHYYAFAGDHGEEIDGRIVNALDEGLLAGKIAPFVAACEPRTGGNRRIVSLAFTDAEQAAYAELREQMFAKYRTPQPIVTRLGDLSHKFTTRLDGVAALLGSDTAVICNLASYADRYKEMVSGVAVGTYAKPPRRLADCCRVVFAEPPIVMTYKRLDIEAMVAPGAEIIDIVGDTKVDKFLCGRVANELSGIDRFMEAVRARL